MTVIADLLTLPEGKTLGVKGDLSPLQAPGREIRAAHRPRAPARAPLESGGRPQSGRVPGFDRQGLCWSETSQKIRSGEETP